MRRIWCIWLLVVMSAVASAAQKSDDNADQFLGQWSGTWEGMGNTGGFNILLEKGADGATACKVAVTGEPAYESTCSKVSFDGNKMTAVYDFTPDDRAEVALSAVFDGKSAKGAWTLRERGTTNEAASGTWAVTKKQ